MDIRFRPIDDWPGPKATRFRASPFTAKYAVTLEELERELKMLNARNAVIQIGLKEGQIRQDGWPKSNAAAPSYPGVIIDFDSKHGHLRYATDEFGHYEDNMRAIALSLEALRKVDRYGVSRRGEQYAGWKALNSGEHVEGDVERGKVLIKEHGSVKAALSATHPDHDGDADDFRAVTAAREHV